MCHYINLQGPYTSRSQFRTEKDTSFIELSYICDRNQTLFLCRIIEEGKSLLENYQTLLPIRQKSSSNIQRYHFQRINV